MAPVDVIILHPLAPPGAGPLTTALAGERAVLAGRHVRAFTGAGASTVRVVEGQPDGRPFGSRLRVLLADRSSGAQDGRGLILLGSGALPLATRADAAAFVSAAAGPGVRALANNRYSADIVALTAGAAARLRDVPAALPADNALPRWLAEMGGVTVDDLRRRWRLAIDLDSPLDALLVAASRTTASHGRTTVAMAALGPGASERIDAVRAVLDDRRAELIVAGRTSAATLAWLERNAACRVRALVEERGLRASSPLATGAGPGPSDGGGSGRAGRPPRSVLGMLLDRDGPAALGDRLAELGDAALVDSRVLLAHRLGPDETGWPTAEDRFASDLLLTDRIADPWLRAVTGAAADGPIPVLLGGHTLVGPGVRLIARVGGSWGRRGAPD